MKVMIFGGDSDMAPAIEEALDQDEVVRVSHEECDVGNFMEVRGVISRTWPNVVINLAGVSCLQPLKGADIQDLFEEVEINLLGSFNVAIASIEKMKLHALIFIGSVAGKYGKPNHAGYCASKAGVISLVQSLAKEGYNAYCISPGRVDTKMRERDFPGEDRKTRLTTKQIAGVVKEILDGKHQPGDNIIIRKRGYRTLRRVDRGEPWRTYLNVGGSVFK